MGRRLLTAVLVMTGSLVSAQPKATTSTAAVLCRSSACAQERRLCPRPIVLQPELAECAVEGRWPLVGTYHSGDGAFYWGAQVGGFNEAGGNEFNYADGAVSIVDGGHYVISVETPVASDCGMHNFVTLKINGVAVSVAESYGGTRIVRNLFVYEKNDPETATDFITVEFTAPGDGGAFAQGAVLRISKDGSMPARSGKN